MADKTKRKPLFQDEAEAMAFLEGEQDQAPEPAARPFFANDQDAMDFLTSDKPLEAPAPPEVAPAPPAAPDQPLNFGQAFETLSDLPILMIGGRPTSPREFAGSVEPIAGAIDFIPEILRQGFRRQATSIKKIAQGTATDDDLRKLIDPREGLGEIVDAAKKVLRPGGTFGTFTNPDITPEEQMTFLPEILEELGVPEGPELTILPSGLPAPKALIPFEIPKEIPLLGGVTTRGFIGFLVEGILPTAPGAGLISKSRHAKAINILGKGSKATEKEAKFLRNAVNEYEKLQRRLATEQLEEAADAVRQIDEGAEAARAERELFAEGAAESAEEKAAREKSRFRPAERQEQIQSDLINIEITKSLEEAERLESIPSTARKKKGEGKSVKPAEPEKPKSLAEQLRDDIDKAKTDEDLNEVMRRLNKGLQDDEIKHSDAPIITSKILGKRDDLASQPTAPAPKPKKFQPKTTKKTEVPTVEGEIKKQVADLKKQAQEAGDDDLLNLITRAEDEGAIRSVGDVRDLAEGKPPVKLRGAEPVTPKKPQEPKPDEPKPEIPEPPAEPTTEIPDDVSKATDEELLQTIRDASAKRGQVTEAQEAEIFRRNLPTRPDAPVAPPKPLKFMEEKLLEKIAKNPPERVGDSALISPTVKFSHKGVIANIERYLRQHDPKFPGQLKKDPKGHKISHSESGGRKRKSGFTFRIERPYGLLLYDTKRKEAWIIPEGEFDNIGAVMAKAKEIAGEPAAPKAKPTTPAEAPAPEPSISKSSVRPGTARKAYKTVKKDAKVDGRKVLDEVPNQDSIDASLGEFEILPGIREIPLSDFHSKPRELFVAKDDLDEVRDLAEAIKESGEIAPSIVVVDKEGPYILEGAHRLGALDILGAKTFPAMVVIDKTPPPAPVKIEAPKLSQKELAQQIEDLGLPRDQTDAQLQLLDARAEAWAKATGRSADEWWENHIAAIQRSEPEALKNDALLQDGNPVFYSTLQQTIEQKMPNRADAQTVRGLTKGLKKEELQWTGLDDFLEEAATEGRQLTKREVLDFLDENQVRLEETVKGADAATKRQQRLEKADSALQNFLRGIGFTETRSRDFAFDISQGLTTPAQQDFLRRHTVLEALAEELRAAFTGRLPEDFNASTKYDNLQLEGPKRDYREMLIRMPVKTPKVEPLTELPEGYTVVLSSQHPLEPYLITPPGQAHARPFAGRHATEEAAKAEALSKINFQRQDAAEQAIEAGGPTPRIFRSSHWDEENIVAHTRFNERVDSDGKRVLFIEEVQSDWHQAGRRKGFNVKTWQVNKPRAGVAGIFTNEEAAQAFAKEKGPGYHVVEGRPQGVPDVPFKNKWHELTFRRMVRWAADHDFDRIAWTTGAQQADRYDLSKHVEMVGYDGDNFKAFDFSGKVVVNRKGVSELDLVELIGKEATEKLLKQKPKGASRFLTGQDLRMGGEGMKTFYDKILVNYANKLGKKFGASTKQIKIPGTPPKKALLTGHFDDFRLREIKINQTNKTAFVVEGLTPDLKWENVTSSQGAFKDRAAAQVFLDGLKEPIPVHGLEITDSMKESALRGLPLFQENFGTPKGATEFLAGENRAIIHLFQGGDISTLAHETAHIFRRELAGDDLAAAEKWAGVKDGNWTTEAEEKFARGFERYLFEGKAPNEKLKAVFEQFKQWLTAIYKTVKGSAIDVELTPEIRRVFENLLGGRGPGRRPKPTPVKGGKPQERLDLGVQAEVPKGGIKVDEPGEMGPLFTEPEPVSRQIEIVTDEPLDDLVSSGVRLRNIDKFKGKLREEMLDLQRRFGPRIFTNNPSAQSLDEWASSLGFESEEELRQALLKHTAKSKRETSFTEALGFPGKRMPTRQAEVPAKLQRGPAPDPIIEPAPPEPAPSSLDFGLSLEAEFNERFAPPTTGTRADKQGIRLALSETTVAGKPTIELSDFFIPRIHKKKGIQDEILDRLMEYAEQQKKRLQIDPDKCKLFR